jgi:hypothetical protein
MCHDIFKRSKIKIENIYIYSSKNKVINETMIIIYKTQIHI